MIVEQGKFLLELCGEIDYVVSFVEFYVEEVKCLNIESVILYFFIVEMELWCELVGVVVLVMLWNFFCVMIICKVVVVLVVGCIVVVYFLVEMLLLVIVLVELVDCVGFLLGVFNVVMGDVFEIVGEWCCDVWVWVLFFIGLIQIGKLLYW